MYVYIHAMLYIHTYLYTYIPSLPFEQAVWCARVLVLDTTEDARGNALYRQVQEDWRSQIDKKVEYAAAWQLEQLLMCQYLYLFTSKTVSWAPRNPFCRRRQCPCTPVGTIRWTRRSYARASRVLMASSVYAANRNAEESSGQLIDGNG